MPSVRRVARPWEKKQASSKPKHRVSSPVRDDLDPNFYRQAKWRKTRQAKLDKDPLCEKCFEQERLVSATMVDHPLPINQGGDPYDESNLMSLCNHCHAVKSAGERRDRQK